MPSSGPAPELRQEMRTSEPIHPGRASVRTVTFRARPSHLPLMISTAIPFPIQADILAASAPEWILWGALGVILYVYLGYPITLALFPRKRGRRADPAPLRVTVVIAAHNEARCIEATVRNKLTLDYPPELLDVIVISDASTDGIDAIVTGIGDPRVLFLRQEPRQGKTAALNLALKRADGDIVVFADANSIHAPDVLRHLLEPFSDPEVGYVTGRLVYGRSDARGFGGGSGLYMRYENVVRSLESRVGSVIGVNGGIDAVRRALYSEMRPDQLPDFVLPLSVLEQGHRVVFAPRALLFEDALASPRDEFRMRVRVSLRAYWGLWDMRSLLSPRRPLVTFQIIVHKILRYAVFFLLLAVLVANAFLLDRPAYLAFFGVQCAAYVLAALGPLLRAVGAPSALLLPLHFVLINGAAAAALVRFLCGHKQATWVPRKGA
jgi:cellulose synthase/poly-beta-1,6-N-acetylglucosamine synthase-like glycosyltransferase